MDEDKYPTYAELSKYEIEGVDYGVEIRRYSAALTVILAPHGGKIEPGTSEVARAIAGGDLSFGTFEGQKDRRNRDLHITSTNFDEPRCVKLVEASRYVVTIHGEGSDRQCVFVGGSNDDLAVAMSTALKEAEIEVSKHKNPLLQGTHPHNICNRGIINAGVQLELSKGLRRRFFKSLTVAGRQTAKPKLKIFAEAVRNGLRAAGAL